MATDFSTEVIESADETVIHVRGEIDIATCERLRDAIEPHLGPQQNLVLDFSEVEFMDSSCLSVLIQARGTLTVDGGSLILRNPSVVARRLLTAAKAQDLLEADADQHRSRFKLSHCKVLSAPRADVVHCDEPPASARGLVASKISSCAAQERFAAQTSPRKGGSPLELLGAVTLRRWRRPPRR
jgi:anti-sigma B factor antagonist